MTEATMIMATALRERRSPERDNPFAPPPEDAPEQPWQPRQPDDSNSSDDSGGPDKPDGSGGSQGGAPDDVGRPRWGSQWSSQQPGRQGGDLGGRPAGPRPGPPGAPRFDPTDPAQRRARYALLCGMWALFAALLNWTPISLLLAALALYWGISSLRMKPEDRAAARAAAAAALSIPEPPRPSGDEKPQRTAAVSGIVTSGIALALIASAFTAHLVYDDYYTCTRDALTSASHDACADLLPKHLRPFLGANNT
ncbi:hypothetical protein, partial [Actinacidiphila oryziradicis]|uniref:hypothetical protein n=1 Tax=Actinacidiphila oryziradicis TaxID=2571141 RepID=UPI0023F37D36